MANEILKTANGLSAGSAFLRGLEKGCPYRIQHSTATWMGNPSLRPGARRGLKLRRGWHDARFGLAGQHAKRIAVGDLRLECTLLVLVRNCHREIVPRGNRSFGFELQTVQRRKPLQAAS